MLLRASVVRSRANSAAQRVIASRRASVVLKVIAVPSAPSPAAMAAASVTRVAAGVPLETAAAMAVGTAAVVVPAAAVVVPAQPASNN